MNVFVILYKYDLDIFEDMFQVHVSLIILVFV